MNDVVMIDRAAQARELLRKPRLEILSQLESPKSCPELARAMSSTTQKMYYHVKALESHGLVRKVGERRVRAIMEGVYQSAARSFWISPRLAAAAGGKRRLSEKISLHRLLELTEQIQLEVGSLASGSREKIPSLSLSAAIELKSANERQAFMAAVQQAITAIAEKFGAIEAGEREGSDTLFHLMLACYPMPTDHESSSETTTEKE